MTRTFRSYPIALGEMSVLPENEIAPKVQIMRVGTFNHPQYGEFEIKREHLESMIKNFESQVRGIDLAIDFAHESDKVAAGWIQSLFLNEDGTQLWATVKWTPGGKESLVNREYRYLSADFGFDYKNNETLQSYGPTLFGAGLTNRPVIKEMAPVIELNEGKGKTQMDEKDKQIADLKAQIADLQKKQGADDSADESGTELAALKKQNEDLMAKCATLEAGAKKAAEEKQMAEKKAAFEKLLSEGKTCEAQREAYMAGDAVKFAELAQPVKLSDQGSSSGKGGSEITDAAETFDEAQDKILKLAEKAVAEKTVKTISEGIRKALAENPKLKEKYEGK